MEIEQASLKSNRAIDSLDEKIRKTEKQSENLATAIADGAAVESVRKMLKATEKPPSIELAA